MIKFYDPLQKKVFLEEVYGEKAMRFLYSPLGAWLRPIFSSRFISQIFGHMYSSKKSASWIPEFIQKFQIPMNEFEQKDWKSFNEFFIRRFRAGIRPFSESKKLPAFAEGRYSFYTVERLNEKHTIKGVQVSLDEVLVLDFLRKSTPSIAGELSAWINNSRLWMAIARLCPTDYHRFHWSDDSQVLHTWNVNGPFDSVHPYALKGSHSILFQNERAITWAEGREIGRHLFIDVAALGVGRIVLQSGKTFARGEERGHFLFGGSTVIGIFDRDKIEPSHDILARTSGMNTPPMETLVRLGSPLA